MDNVFWWGIVLGGAVGFVVSIVANLSTPTFGSYFQRSRAGWVEHGKRRALKQYEFILRFREGKEDKYMYFVAQWGYILFYVIMSVFMFLIGTKLDERGERLLQLTGYLAGLASLMRCLWVNLKLTIWYWRMNNFDEYRMTLLRKWPELQLDNPLLDSKLA